MMRPTSSSAAASPKVTLSQAKGMRSRARTPYDMVAVVAFMAPRSERRAPRRRTHRRDGRSRETCRGWRRPATAARYPPACATAAPPRPPLPASLRASVGHTPLSAPMPARPCRSARRGAPCRETPRQRREILALALAAGDHHQRPGMPARRRASRPHWCLWNRRCSARRRYRPPTLIDAPARGSDSSASSMAGGGRPTASPSASAASALAALCRPEIFMRDSASSGLAASRQEISGAAADQREIRIGALNGESQPLRARPGCDPRAVAHRRDQGSSTFNTTVAARRRCAPWPARTPRARGSDPVIGRHVEHHGRVQHSEAVVSS